MPADYGLAIIASVWDEMASALDAEIETAGVLLAGFADDLVRPTILVSRVIWVPEDDYLERTNLSLRIRSHGWMPAVGQAANEGRYAIFFHTHPGGSAKRSHRDAEVDRVLSGPFQIRTARDWYASLILGGTTTSPELSGRVVDSSGSTRRISRVRVVGSQIKIIPACDAGTEVSAQKDIHDRQVLALGAPGQKVLADLRVGVVGVGGTGSSVVEQLTRLGVGQLVLLDDDRISATNVSRVYGSTLGDVGTLKVDVAATHARRIGASTEIQTYSHRLNSPDALRTLRGCDVVFGCTDDHVGRFNLSRFSYFYLVPVIDLGVVIDTAGGEIRSITGRVSFMGPGEPCLVCGGVVDINRVRDESYTKEERSRLADEGYARGLDDRDPSVVAYTTMVAAWGVADLLERLFSFGVPNVRPELRIRIADKKMTTRTGVMQPGHFCTQPMNWGSGDREPFLGQAVWPS